MTSSWRKPRSSGTHVVDHNGVHRESHVGRCREACNRKVDRWVGVHTPTNPGRAGVAEGVHTYKVKAAIIWPPLSILPHEAALVFPRQGCEDNIGVCCVARCLR